VAFILDVTFAFEFVELAGMEVAAVLVRPSSVCLNRDHLLWSAVALTPKPAAACTKSKSLAFFWLTRAQSIFQSPSLMLISIFGGIVKL
jgi:hypothetical protein